MKSKVKKTWTKKKTIFLCIILLLCFFVLPLGITIILYEQNFGFRTKPSTRPYALRFEDTNTLTRDKMTFHSKNKVTLTGYLYTSKANSTDKGLVVVSHGLGGGHIDYLNEIEYFATNGYKVFAFDNTGCNESEGKTMVGLAQSGVDLDYALTFIENKKELNHLPILLYGHSWGGYAVTAVLNKEHTITAAVANSGFNRSKDMLIEQGKDMIGNFIYIASPFLSLYEYIKFGSASLLTGVNGVNKNQIPILLLHSEDDPTVSIKSSVVSHKDEFTTPLISIGVYTDKGHYITESYEAKEYINKKNEEGKELEKTYNQKIPKEILDQYYKSVDKTLKHALDTEVMDRIVAFFDEAVLN